MNTAYPQIPYGWADFEAMRRERTLYVDKTRFLHDLERERFALLIRPRRFGKSCWEGCEPILWQVAEKTSQSMARWATTGRSNMDKELWLTSLSSGAASRAEPARHSGVSRCL